jgi:hypothetical protein
MTAEYKTCVSMEGERIVEDGGQSVARFSIDARGTLAFNAFLQGARANGASVYDSQNEQFLVGDIGQLDTPA